MQESLESVDDLPRAFGDYTLIKPLGRGGMGQVFLARLKARGLAGVDKICVVKTLRRTTDPEYERRFIDEARLIVLLSHKNICPVFDAGCFEGEYYLALEHIAGREVRHLQTACEARGAPLPGGIVIHIIKETLEALDAAHRMVHPLTKEPLRVVHRDVSPQNVMISEEGEVKLIDFGLAVSSQKLERTAPQIVMGKMAYMAPEQARGDVVDARADQFAAGVMLYELLTNERYYGDLAIDGIWRMSGRGGHVPAKLATLDDGLQRIIVRATAANRDDRFASCADMRDALTAIELQRGSIAGSREVRAALLELDSPQPAPTPQPAMPSQRPIPPPSAPQQSTPSQGIPPPSAPQRAPTPPAPLATTTIVDGLGPREKTRTFRIVPADSSMPTETGLIEGLEPGTLITGDTFRSVDTSLMPPPFASAGDASSDGFSSAPVVRAAATTPLLATPRTESPLPAFSGRGGASEGGGTATTTPTTTPTTTTEPPPPTVRPAPRAVEATVVVRNLNALAPQAPAPAAGGAGTSQRRRLPIAALVAGLVLAGVAVLAVVVPSRPDDDASTPTTTPPTPTTTPPTATTATTATTPTAPTAPTAETTVMNAPPIPVPAIDPAAATDAGTLAGATDAGTLAAMADAVDAGGPGAVDVIGDDSVDGGAVPDGRRRPRFPIIVRRKRDLPPFPAVPLFQTEYLQKHCSDLRCAKRLHGAALQAMTQAEIGRAAEVCFHRCEERPPR